MKVARTVLRRAALGNKCRLSDKSAFRILLSHFLGIATLIEPKFQSLLSHLASGSHDKNELWK